MYAGGMVFPEADTMPHTVTSSPHSAETVCPICLTPVGATT